MNVFEYKSVGKDQIMKKHLVFASVIISGLLATLIVVMLLVGIPQKSAFAQGKSMETLFQSIQQKGQPDSKFRYNIDYYGPGCQGVCVLAVSGAASTIADIGSDYVCLKSIMLDNNKDNVVTMCLPFSSITRIESTDTLFK